jgi:hypothetical protein
MDFSRLHTLGVYGSDPVLTLYALDRDGYAPLMLIGYNGSFYSQYGAPYYGAAERSLKGKAADMLAAKRDEMSAAYTAYNERRRAETPAAAPAPETPAPAPAVNGLEKAIASAVAGIAADELKTALFDDLKKRIAEEIGVIPRRIEIEYNGVKKEIKGITHEKYAVVAGLVARKIPVFLTGAAGTGKNHLAAQIAEGLGLHFYFSGCITQEYKLTGFVDAHGRYNETQFYRAFKDGGLFFMDELDGSIPDALITINAAIANGYFDFPCGAVTAHPDFRVIAAGNTYGTGADDVYTGRAALDGATLDRFALVDIDYSPAIEELSADGDRAALDFCRAVRKAAAACGIRSLVVSYRGIKNLVNAAAVFGDNDLAGALRSAIFKGLAVDDVQILVNAVKGLDGNKYYEAAKAYAAKGGAC